MAMQFRPVGLPGKEYDQQEESQFRRNIESYLLEISSTINSAESSTDGHASAASKRESLLLNNLECRLPVVSDLKTQQTVSVVLTPGTTGNEFVVYSGQRVMFIDSASATDVWYIKGGSQGDVVTLMKNGSASHIHVHDGATGGGGLRLASAPFIFNSTYDNITFCLIGSVWVETARTKF